jgi:hypothetical protein
MSFLYSFGSMGNSNSADKKESSRETVLKNTNEIVKSKITYFKDSYNWIPSFCGYDWKLLDKQMAARRFDMEETMPNYVDLRNQFPPIRSMHPFPFNPIMSVLYVAQYQQLRNGLPVFPLSAMYIYKNLQFYRSVNSLFSFECVFRTIQNAGLCSENDFRTSKENLERVDMLPNELVEKSRAFQFIDVYRVDHDLELIKRLIKNEIPVLCGFVVYYDMNGIQTHMYMPLIDRDTKMGGLTGVLVGYIEERKTFIMTTTFGPKYGSSGYIFVPYQYILDPRLTMELYVMDFQKDRVESYILQRKKMTELESTELKLSEKKYKRDDFGSLFK